MEFPGTKFTKKYRIAYFIIVILIFCILTPLIILHTAGYSYDFNHGIVKETGGISIDIKPKEANVYIDDVLIKQGMPIRLKNATPGKYTIKIDAGENYYLWEKEIDVEKRQTIYIKEISLIKKTIPQLFKKGNIKKQKLSKDGKYLAYILIANELPEIWIYNLENNEDKLVMRLSTDKNFNLNWGENHHSLIISEDVIPLKELYIVNAEKLDEIISLGKLEKKPIYKFMWNNSNDPEIFYSTSEEIYSFKPSSKTTYDITPNDFIDWYMENGKLWTLQYDEGKKTYTIIQDTVGYSSEFGILNNGKYDNYKIATAKDNHILLQHETKPEMILLDKEERYNLAGENFYISDYNDWWLIWTPWELRTYSYEEEPKLINRSGEQLKQVLPLDKYNTLGLVWAEKTTVLFPYYLVRHALVEGQINNVEIDIENKILYFTDEEGIWKLIY